MPAVYFEVWCSCGSGLCNQTKDVKGGVEVEPCKDCLEKARDEGYATGYDKGYDEGYNDGQASIKED